METLGWELRSLREWLWKTAPIVEEAWARLTAPAVDKPSDVPGQDARTLDITEAATRLGISKDWLYRHASALPFALRIGRRLVFDSVALERWNRRRVER